MADLGRAVIRSLRWFDATRLHYVSIFFACGVIAYLGRDQWFFFDEWTFLIPDAPGILVPHIGHLSAVPMALTWALRSVFGLSTYWPYWLIAVGTHLAVAHLLWRVMRRAHVSPWIATALALLMMLLGPGHENIFWAFQYGFMGAMALALGVVLIVSRSGMRAAGCVAASVLALAGLATSGTSIPILAVAVLLAIRANGWIKTAVVFVVPIGIYGLWYVSVPRQPGAIDSLPVALTFIPQFVGRMITDSLESLLPFPGFGVILLVGLGVWLVIALRRLWSPRVTLPVALVLSCLIFGGITAYSRFGFGISLAHASRYSYYVVAMLLPSFGAALTVVVENRRRAVAVASVCILLTTTYDLGILAKNAATAGESEQAARRQIYAALDIALKHPDSVDPAARVELGSAPELTVQRLVKMHELGWINVGRYTEKDELDAKAMVSAIVTPAVSPVSCSVGPSTITIAAGKKVTIAAIAAGAVSITVANASGLVGDAQILNVQPAGYTISNKTGLPLTASGLPAGTQLCAT